MPNKEILTKLLKPVNSKDVNNWNAFLEIVDENILWHPSAGNDFKDLIFHFLALSETSSPSAYIHTDYFPDLALFEFIKNKTSFIEDNLEFYPEDCIELTNNGFNISSQLEYKFLPYHLAVIMASANNEFNILEKLKSENVSTSETKWIKPKSFEDYVKLGKEARFKFINKIFLLKIKVTSENKSEYQYVLYAFYDNVLFQNIFIIEGNLNLSNIWNKHLIV